MTLPRKTTTRIGGHGGQDKDAVVEGQAIAAEGEVAGEELVPGHEAGQAGKVGERGVRRQHQQ